MSGPHVGPHVDPATGVDLHALGEEMLALRQNRGPAAHFYIYPFEAYTLLACLQGTARNPHLTPGQHEIVLDFARQIQGELVKMARAILGPDSLVERTTEMGFAPAFDVSVERGGADPGAEPRT